MFFEAIDDIDVAGQGSTVARAEHDIGGREIRLVGAKRFTNETLESIALDGSRNYSRGDCETEPRMVELIRANQHRK